MKMKMLRNKNKKVQSLSMKQKMEKVRKNIILPDFFYTKFN